MLKFIPGILLLQVITIGLVLIGPTDLGNWGWLRVAIPVVMAGCLTAFWFGSLSAHQRKDDIGRLKEQYAREREAIRVNAERAKTRLVKQAHQETLQAVQRSNRRANIKVGLAFAGAAGVGGFLILMQFMSLGLLTLAGAGGALGGYLWRSRQERNKLQLPRGIPGATVIGAPSQGPKPIANNDPRP
ncbi:MAG: hypothetical protein WAM73_04100 [Desulfobacterales bacterium]